MNTNMRLSPEIFVSQYCNEISNFTKKQHVLIRLGYVMGHLQLSLQLLPLVNT